MEGMGKSDFPITTTSLKLKPSSIKESRSCTVSGLAKRSGRSCRPRRSILPQHVVLGIAMSATGDFKPGYQNILNPIRQVHWCRFQVPAISGHVKQSPKRES